MQTVIRTYRKLSLNLMVTTNLKSIIDTQKVRRKESKHNTKKIIKSQRKRVREEKRERN